MIFLLQPNVVSSGATASLDTAPFAAVAASAQTITGWALLVIGGSVVALLQRSYVRSRSVAIRLIYLLFVPGWLFLAFSIYYGTRVQGVYLAALFVSHPDLRVLKVAGNSDFADQLTCLRYGLLFFSLWLVVYLLWWIFTSEDLSSQ
jgi:hypothetical protein